MGRTRSILQSNLEKYLSMVDLENEAGGNWNTDFLSEYFYVYF
jgi:hypothetical protein